MGGKSRVEGRRCWWQWTEADARAALAELARSGESLAEFARSRGVSTQRVRYWKKRLGASEQAAFVAVRLPEAVPSTVVLGAHVDILWAGVTVRVREDLDVEHVARIVYALARRAVEC